MLGGALLEVALLALLVVGPNALAEEGLAAADASVDGLLDAKLAECYMWENYRWRMGRNWE